MKNADVSRILLVDDSPMNLILLQGILGDNYDTFVAESAEQALTVLENLIPDLILLDVEMPGMNGYELISKLKSDPRWIDIPVIFLTAQEGRDKEEEAFLLGAVDYIQKPISTGVVSARVNLHLELALYRRSLESMVAEKTEKLSKTQDTILDVLASVTAFRDKETGSHIKRTTLFGQRLLDYLAVKDIEGYRFSPVHASNIIKSLKLHDIGKVAVPDSVLLKPGKLTAREFDIMKLHTTYGAQMIDDAIKDLGDDSFLYTAREIILSHHEKWNGTGYPQGLSGTDIPLSGRTMAIADVYDALISKRPYKEPFSHEMAKEIIIGDRGAHFDPILTDAFISIESDFHLIAAKYKD